MLPDVAPRAAPELVDKRGLERLCRQHGVPVPRSTFLQTMSDLDMIADLDEPIVVKSAGPRSPNRGKNTLVVPDRTALRQLLSTLAEPFDLTLQQYLPDEHGEDWFTVGYCDAAATANPVFTDARPARAGQGRCSLGCFTALNTELAEMAATFCKDIGYRGIFDMDWRRDVRTGAYTLLISIPDPGAQFRMFENDAGVDVVRAMHLDLSVRAADPAGLPLIGERFIIEPWDLANRLAHRRDRPALAGSGRAR